MTNELEIETPDTDTQAETQNEFVTVTLNIHQLNVIATCLQELPHRVAAPILQSLIQQAQEQLQA
jgi:hypothetical protein